MALTENAATSSAARNLSAPLPVPGEASFFYTERGFNSRAVKVLPGEHYCTGDDMALVTVLGSCVSACIRDAGVGIGGMNHFMLPDGADNDVGGASGRYGAFAMELLINELIKRGARRERLEAKVFGGGHVLKGMTTLNVGERNAGFVRKFLATERIRIVSEDLMDFCPRKVCFFPVSGRALVKRLPTDDVIVREERKYSERLTKTDVVGDIELF